VLHSAAAARLFRHDPLIHWSSGAAACGSVQLDRDPHCHWSRLLWARTLLGYVPDAFWRVALGDIATAQCLVPPPPIQRTFSPPRSGRFTSPFRVIVVGRVAHDARMLARDDKNTFRFFSKGQSRSLVGAVRSYGWGSSAALVVFSTGRGRSLFAGKNIVSETPDPPPRGKNFREKHAPACAGRSREARRILW